MADKKRRNENIPKGDGFMAGTSMREIQDALKKEKNGKAVNILLACMWRREGKDGMWIACKLHIPASTIYDRLRRMHLGGLDACPDKTKPGRPRKIRPEIHSKISEAIDRQPGGCGVKSNVWTGRLILIMISGLFSIDNVSPSTAYRTMHRLNKTYRKPGRPRHGRSPSDEVKAEFKRSLAKDIFRNTVDGHRLFWMDESHFTTKTIRGMTWLARSLSIPQVIKPFGRSYTCFGALGLDGLLHHRYYDCGNTDSMIDFVNGLHDAYGKVLLVMDNASIHKSKKLMAELEKYGGDVRIIHQPTYSPDLNPVEMVWKELKRYVANGLYRRVEDMTGAMDEMIQSGTVSLPQLPEYATDAIRRARATAAA